MTISVDWPTGVIHVEQSDLTALGGSRYQLDVDAFRLTLRALEASEAGMPWPATHVRSDPYTISGTTYAQGINFINGYTVEFENGMYEVRLVGANTNLADVKVVNSVSVIPSNAAGLITVASGSGLSAEQDATLTSVGARVDVAVSTRSSATSQSTQTTWLERIATVLGVPNTAGYVHTSSGTVGAGGVLTTARRIGGALWTTITTANAGTATEQSTVTPETLP